MRDPSRIPKVLEALRRVWEASPDLRLTQLLLNVTRFHCPEMFVMEDDVLMRRIAEFEDAARRPRESKLPPDLAPVHLPPAAFELIDDLPFHVDAARRILLARWKMSSTHRFTLWMAPDGSPIENWGDGRDLVKIHHNIPTKDNSNAQGMGFALGLLLRAGYKPGMTAEETRAALAARERPAADRHTSTSTPVCPHCGHMWPEVRKPPPTDGPASSTSSTERTTTCASSSARTSPARGTPR